MTLAKPSPGSKTTRTRKGLNGNKRYRELAADIEAAGGEIRRASGAGGHPRVFYHGQFVCSLSSTTGDVRARANVVAKMRRAGMEIT